MLYFCKENKSAISTDDNLIFVSLGVGSMQATILYTHLDRDFIHPELSDDFSEYMPDMWQYMTDSFRSRSMGVVCDFSQEIHRVYTAVFPSKRVMNKLLKDASNNPDGTLLFLHHPIDWGCRNGKLGWTQIPTKLIETCKKMNISIYAIHTPLDNYGRYSTGRTLAEAMGLTIIEPFIEYRGGLAGIIGRTRCKTTMELSNLLCSVFGHAPKLYPYGSETIIDGVVAVITGGGNNIGASPVIVSRGINTFVTGVSVCNEVSSSIHQYEQAKGINLFGGTHYSTEKFACMNMCYYFRKLGLPAQFIDDTPTLEDL